MKRAPAGTGRDLLWLFDVKGVVPKLLTWDHSLQQEMSQKNPASYPNWSTFSFESG